LDEPDQGHATHANSAAFGKPCAGAAADRQPDIQQKARQGHGPSGAALHELGHLLGEGAARAGPRSTPKATDLQLDLHGSSTEGLVGNSTGVVAMHPS